MSSLFFVKVLYFWPERHVILNMDLKAWVLYVTSTQVMWNYDHEELTRWFRFPNRAWIIKPNRMNPKIFFTCFIFYGNSRYENARAQLAVNGFWFYCYDQGFFKSEVDM